MHRRLQIRKQAPQSKMRKLRPKGLLRLLSAGVAENANQPTFYVEPDYLRDMICGVLCHGGVPNNMIFLIFATSVT